MDRISWTLVFLGIAGLVISGWITWLDREEKNTQWKLGVLGVVVATAMTAIGVIQGLRDAAEAAELKRGVENANRNADEAKLLIPKTTGLLVPGDKPTPDIGGETLKKIEGERGEGYALKWGSNDSWVKKLPLLVLYQGNESMLLLEGDEKGIMLSAKIFREDGKRACVIDRNVFTATDKDFRMVPTPRDSHRWTKIEVKDGSDRRVLEVEFLNPRAFQIFGDFFVRHGRRVELEPDKPSVVGLNRTFHCSFVDAYVPLDVQDYPELPSRQAGTDAAISIGKAVIDKPVVGEPLYVWYLIANSGIGPITVVGQDSASGAPEDEGQIERAVSDFQRRDVVGRTPLRMVPGQGEMMRGSAGTAMTDEHIAGTAPYLVFGSFVYVDAVDQKRRVWFTLRYNAATKSLDLVDNLGNVKPFTEDWTKKAPPSFFKRGPNTK